MLLSTRFHWRCISQLLSKPRMWVDWNSNFERNWPATSVLTCIVAFLQICHPYLKANQQIRVIHLLAEPTADVWYLHKVTPCAPACQDIVDRHHIVNQNALSVQNVLWFNAVLIKSAPILVRAPVELVLNVSSLTITLSVVAHRDMSEIHLSCVFYHLVCSFSICCHLLNHLNTNIDSKIESTAIEEPKVPSNLCDPNPCGPNSICQIREGHPVCSCIANYLGSPPYCRPECVLNQECPFDKACIHEKCLNPCTKSCGLNAKCDVVNHTPYCTCLPGYEGDAFISCSKIPPSKHSTFTTFGKF